MQEFIYITLLSRKESSIHIFDRFSRSREIVVKVILLDSIWIFELFCMCNITPYYTAFLSPHFGLSCKFILQLNMLLLFELLCTCSITLYYTAFLRTYFNAFTFSNKRLLVSTFSSRRISIIRLNIF